MEWPTPPKSAYDHKLCKLLDEFTQVLVAVADNVGSKQLQGIRSGLRGDSVVLMGKNTMMKSTIRVHSEKTGNQAILNLIPLLQGNVGLIFTKGDLKGVSEDVSKYKGVHSNNVAVNVVASTWTESFKTHGLTRTASSRLSRDLDIDCEALGLEISLCMKLKGRATPGIAGAPH